METIVTYKRCKCYKGKWWWQQRIHTNSPGSRQAHLTIINMSLYNLIVLIILEQNVQHWTSCANEAVRIKQPLLYYRYLPNFHVQLCRVVAVIVFLLLPVNPADSQSYPESNIFFYRVSYQESAGLFRAAVIRDLAIFSPCSCL